MKRMILFSALLAVVQAHSTICKQGFLERIVEVRPAFSENKVPCEVFYKKENSEAKSIFNASAELGYCEKKASELISQLQSLGWTCDGVQAAEEQVAKPEALKSALAPKTAPVYGPALPENKK